MEILKLLTDKYDSNTFILTEGDFCLIIDSGAKPEIVKNLVGEKKIVGVLLTHGHFDHAYYSKQYYELFGCPVFCHENAKLTMSSPERSYGDDFSLTDLAGFEFLKGDGTLNLVPFEINYYSTPGHSKCSMCFLIGGDLFAGDPLFENGIGRTDLIGSSKEEMIASLEKLNNLEFKQAYSGHGENSDFARQKRNITIFKRFLMR